ncbi:MAG: DEAD/DEAH box helicase family protein [Treponemataceae bacterium]|nr:DEAD/DEAH box helicase family protein [Treponemataceae bacterium]
MLQEAKDLQKSAVSKLVQILATGKKEITFKAPTGSGKTYMMTDFMNRVLAANQNAVFIVSTLSKSNLAQQNYESFQKLAENGTFANLNPFLINSDSSGEGSLYIPTDYNVYVLPRDLYKDSSKLKKEGTFLNFLKSLTGDTFMKQAEKTVYLIKDECHIATSNLDELKEYFHQIINFSATPKLSRKQEPDVEISNTDAENVKLIKSVEQCNETDSLNTALEKFEKIRKDYINLLEVNPCFIIQISNKDKAEEELKNNIMPALENHQDLKWVYINDKGGETNDSGLKKLPVSKWKDYMKGKESTISVIIFKMVISEGWDIPRACMLYQIRDSKSKQLDEQVMGRVRRNPRLLDFETLSQEAKHLACTAWIWGIIPKDEHLPKQVNLFADYEIETKFRIKPVKLQNISSVKKHDMEEFLNNLKDDSLTHPSIFDSYQRLLKQDNEIQNFCYDYADDFRKWSLFTENLGAIKSSYEKYICDYEKSMVVCGDVGFPAESCFIENANNLTLDDWIWCRKDRETDFSFDSEAEKKWAELLKDIRSNSIGTAAKNENALFEDSRFLWGKNFPLNSEIKYEYYLDGVHSSYPDFVMKDKNGHIHIFEVKSVNKSSSINIDEEEYKNKVNALKACYKAASKKTGHIFYFPILDKSTWKITKYENGAETVIDKSQFIASLK